MYGLKLACLGSALFLLAGCGGGAMDNDDCFPPKPAISAISPQSVSRFSPPVTLGVTGNNFRPRSRVVWDEGIISTTYMDTSHVLGSVSFEKFQYPGTVQVRVFTPPNKQGPDCDGALGAISEPVTFTITP